MFRKNMAQEATKGAQGPLAPVAAPPAPPEGLSRYRSLRGKSISSMREFAVLPNENGGGGGGGSAEGNLSRRVPGSRPPLSRSLTNLRHAWKRHESAAPPVSGTRKGHVLHPKPVDMAAQSRLRMLEELKSPSSLAGHAPWSSLSGVTRGEASGGGGHDACRDACRDDAGWSGGGSGSRTTAGSTSTSTSGSGSGSGSGSRTTAGSTSTSTSTSTSGGHGRGSASPSSKGSSGSGSGSGSGTGTGSGTGPGSGAGTGMEVDPTGTMAVGPHHHHHHHHHDAPTHGSHHHQAKQSSNLLPRSRQEASTTTDAAEKINAGGDGVEPEPEAAASAQAGAEAEAAAEPEADAQAGPEPAVLLPARERMPVAVPKQHLHSSPSHTSETIKGGQRPAADEVARLEAETDRILAEQKKLDLARLQAQLVTPPKTKRHILQKLSFFSRSKRSTAMSKSSQPSSPSTVVSAIFSPTISHNSRASSLEEPTTPSAPAAKTMSFIQPGGKGIVPQTDAPISASNGGERRVVVRCLSSTINLPVTGDTSPQDILKATADITRHRLTPASCVIVECYSVSGLERRLRRYERIRDVMNSWDRDQQNSLLVLSCDNNTDDDDRDLDIESVPRTEEPPGGFSVQMYHSSKPGRWNRRWVTLLDNGQIYAAKSANAQPSDRDCAVLCHLTDFDIYAPKESEMRRNLKPPKRFCYAIKSQQKTVVFPNGENFVHFFSTEDAQEAASFYEKVHGWRSWYMVNRMVDLRRSSRPPQLELDAIKRSKSSAKKSGGSRIGGPEADGEKTPDCAADEAASDDEPLMDVNTFRMSKILLDGAPTHKSLGAGSKAPAARTKYGTFTPGGIPQTVLEEEPEFSVGGLLGNTYDEKRRQAEAHVASPPGCVDGPFTEGPSLLNGGIAASTSQKQAEQDDENDEPESWFPSAAEHSARTRHTHQQQQQRRPMTADSSAGGMPPRRETHPPPLLNLNKDAASEPPRHQGGPSGVPRNTSGQPLINFVPGAGVAAARDARDGAVRRNFSRRGPTSSGLGVSIPPPLPPLPPPPPGGSKRQRSRSNASQRRHFPGEPLKHAPVPPMPMPTGVAVPMPLRRVPHGEAPPSRPGPTRCPPEPLVSRAR